MSNKPDIHDCSTRSRYREKKRDASNLRIKDPNHGYYEESSPSTSWHMKSLCKQHLPFTAQHHDVRRKQLLYTASVHFFHWKSWKTKPQGHFFRWKSWRAKPQGHFLNPNVFLRLLPIFKWNIIFSQIWRATFSSYNIFHFASSVMNGYRSSFRMTEGRP